MRAAIEAIGVAQGELDNVVRAALRDVGENVVATMRRDWPVGVPRPGHTHSAERWDVTAQGDEVTIRNDADYASYVHHDPQHGGPVGLADRTVPALIEEVSQAPLEFVTQRVIDLLEGGR